MLSRRAQIFVIQTCSNFRPNTLKRADNGIAAISQFVKASRKTSIPSVAPRTGGSFFGQLHVIKSWHALCKMNLVQDETCAR
jgi:hypothetical protein